MMIRISRGATVNLGNYETARIDISIEDDVANVADLDQVVREELGARLLDLGVPANFVERYGARVVEVAPTKKEGES